jgi:hypothetical protein
MGFLRRRGYPFKFAHLSRDVSSTFGSHDARLSMMNPVGNFGAEAIAIKMSWEWMPYGQGEAYRAKKE